jgi:predicted RecB family nuclease
MLHRRTSFRIRTTIEDVANFVKCVGYPHLHVVRGDDYLLLASQALRREKMEK